ncbi:MAG: hypothetical protein CSB46_02945 [Micrococcales bacterium]|nr:MAG: hypothetical protein CSB46_02945 [Micrococcales bacterium]
MAGFTGGMVSENPWLTAKVVDTDRHTPQQAAEIAVDELTRGDAQEGPEIGYIGNQRYVLQTVAEPLAGDDEVSWHPPDGSTVLVSAAAGDLVGEFVTGLAERTRARVVVLEPRSPVNPITHERVLQRVCDVTDPVAVRSIVADTAAIGPVVAVVHAAAGRPVGPLTEATALSARETVRAKGLGLHCLWHATRDQPVQRILCLEQVSAGRASELAATALLSSLSAELTGDGPARVCTVQTPAPAPGAGLSAAQIADHLLAELGHGCAPARVHVLAEQVRPPTGQAPAWASADPHSLDFAPGTEHAAVPETAQTPAATAGPAAADSPVRTGTGTPEPAPSLLSSINRTSHQCQADAQLDPRAQRFLEDYKIRGLPALAGAFQLELQAQAAATLHPGLHLHSIRDAELHPALTVQPEQVRIAQVNATTQAPAQGVRRVVVTTLGLREPDDAAPAKTHSRASLTFGPPRPRQLAGLDLAAELSAGRALDLSGFDQAAHAVVATGPSLRRIERAALATENTVIAQLGGMRRMSLTRPGSPAVRIGGPKLNGSSRGPNSVHATQAVGNPETVAAQSATAPVAETDLLAVPVYLENAARAALIWALHQRGWFIVPAQAEVVQIYQQPDPAQSIYCSATISRQGPDWVSADILITGSGGRVLATAERVRFKRIGKLRGGPVTLTS